MTVSAKKAQPSKQPPAAPVKIAAPKTLKAVATRRTEAPKKEVVSSVSSRDIDQHVKAFLKAGGKIQKIPNGVSGQQNGPLPTRKHIVISRKKPE